jgi:hypothetical protein
MWADAAVSWACFPGRRESVPGGSGRDILSRTARETRPTHGRARGGRA